MTSDLEAVVLCIALLDYYRCLVTDTLVILDIDVLFLVPTITNNMGVLSLILRQSVGIICTELT